MPPPLAQGRFYGPPKAAAPTTVGPGQRNPTIGPYEGRGKGTTPSVSCRAEDPLRGDLIRRCAPPVHLAVPEKPFGLTLILRFFDRCGNCEFPSSATGGGNSQFPVRGEGFERAGDDGGPFESTMKTRWSYDPSVIRRTVTRRMPPPLAQGRFYGPPREGKGGADSRRWSDTMGGNARTSRNQKRLR